jgi:hypothetical protein
MALVYQEEHSCIMGVYCAVYQEMEQGGRDHGNSTRSRTRYLELLLRLTQRFGQLRQHRMLWPQFTLVNRWIPAWRYTADLANRQDATDFVEAVAQLMQWLEHNV